MYEKRTSVNSKPCSVYTYATLNFIGIVSVNVISLCQEVKNLVDLKMRYESALSFTHKWKEQQVELVALVYLFQQNEGVSTM